jgi:hypothetical protein
MTIFTHPKKRDPKQKELAHFVEQLREHDEEMDDKIFNRKERLSNLEEGKFANGRDTIFSAILQELNKRKKKE